MLNDLDLEEEISHQNTKNNELNIEKWWNRCTKLHFWLNGLFRIFYYVNIILQTLNYPDYAAYERAFDEQQKMLTEKREKELVYLIVECAILDLFRPPLLQSKRPD